MPNVPDIQIADDYQSLFDRHGLTDFITMIKPPDCQVLRMIPERANLKFTLQDRHRERVFYLKVHPPQQVPWLKRSQGQTSAGVAEYATALQVAKAGLPCYNPVACGVDKEGSFFISEDLYGSDQLDHFLQINDVAPQRLQGLVDQLAELAAAFHTAGFAHKDFYLCHFFYNLGSQELHLIDLQRTIQHETIPLRARVKDLAALWYSWQQVPALSGLWQRLFDRYVNKTELPIDRQHLWKKIQRKTDRIRRHDEKSKRLRPLPVIQDERA